MELALGWIVLGVVMVAAVAGVLFLLGFIDLITGAPLSIIACISGLAVAFLIALLLFASVAARQEVRVDRRWVLEEHPPQDMPASLPAPPRGEIDPAEPFVVDSISNDGTVVVGIPVDPITESSETEGTLPDWTKLTDENLEKLPVATGLFPSRADCLTELETAARRRAVDVLAARRGPVPAESIPASLVSHLIQTRHIESSHSETLGQTMYKAHGLLKFDAGALRQLDEVWREQTVGDRLTGAGSVAAVLFGLLTVAWGGLKLTARKREPAPAAV